MENETKEIKETKEEEPMEFHRYESDRTRKENREIEKQKLKAMDWKGKIEYIFTYYKSVMFAFVAAIFAIVVIGQAIYNSQYVTILNVSVIGATLTETEGEIQEELEEQFGTGEKFEEVIFDASYLTREDGSIDQNTAAKFTAVLAAGDMDILILNQMWYYNYVGQDMFLDLSTLFTEEECETYGITEGMDHIDATGTKWLENHKWVDYEPVYITAINNSGNQRKIKEFIIAVMEEQ